MVRSFIAAVAMILAPALLLVAAAHTSMFSHRSAALAYVMLFLAWLIGLGAIRMGGWSHRVTAGAMVVYTIVAIPALPFAGLLAVCSTGDCI